MRRCRKPSVIDRSPIGVPPPLGTSAGSRTAAANATENVATSIPYTALSPVAEINTPASAGPATNASCWIVVCRAIDAVTSCASTSIGKAARLAGQSTP